MAGRIAGITIEIGGDATPLQKALKSVDSTLKGTQKSLKDIDKLLKFNPGNTELLTQKQKQLIEAISATKERLEQLKSAQDGVAKGTAEWDALQREIIATETDLRNLESEYESFGSVAAQQIKVIGEKMQTIGKKMQEIGEWLTKYVTLPIVAVGTKGVKSFADVDKTMQLTNKTMGNTAEEAERLNNAMEEAAANSTFGMTDAAEATLNFARAGLDAEQAASALAPAMNLAAGEGGNLDTVSAGLVGTINGFGDSFDKTAHYADVFAAACNNSALDVDSLSEAMSVAAPIFKTAGYEIEDAALYMGVMANNGIDAKTAANALKTGIARLVKPSKEGAEYIEKLGISVTNADGSMKDSLTVQRELNAAFSNLSESEQIAAASAIFGKNQMSNWLALINTAPSEVDALSNSLNNCEGVTNEMADAMMGGFGGSIEKLKSSLDVLMTSIGSLLSEYLQPVIDKVQSWVDKFNALDEGTQQTIVKIGLIVAAIGPLLLVGGKLITGIGMLLTFAPAIATAMGAVTLPMLGIVAAIAAVVAAGVYLYKHWDELKAKAAEIWAQLKETVSTVAENIKQAVSEKWANIKDETKKRWEDVKANITETWDTIKETVTKKAEEMRTSLQDKLDLMKQAIKENGGGIRGIVSTTWNGVKSIISNTWETINTLTNGKLDALKEKVTTLFENIKTAISEKIDAIKNLFNFEWSFPQIKLPHFSWTWQSVGSWFSIPHISVDWYKKAYNNPVMFTSPTVLGTASGVKGFGDGHGAEIVMGLDKLRELVGSQAREVTINIIQQPWQDAKALAFEVQKVLVAQDEQRSAAYA